MVGLELHMVPGGEKVSIFCLSVTLLNGRLCANDFTIKALEYGNIFDTIQ